MKTVITSLMLIAVLPAQAQQLVSKGTSATLTAEYGYINSGKAGTAAGGGTQEWDAKRRIVVIAQMSADAPQPMGTMHKPDSAQQADMKNKEARAENAHQKMAPLMADMEKIARDCGDDEACITRAVSKYGLNMQMTPELASAREDVAAAMKQGAARYQLWRAVSQDGTYSINETHRRQTFEMTCTDKPGQICKSEEMRTGGGAITAPGGRSVAGASMLEVDGIKKDLIVHLPMPIVPLTYTRTVVTTIPGEKNSTTQTVLNHFLDVVKPITATISADLRAAGGTETIKLEDGGTLTVKWRFEVR